MSKYQTYYQNKVIEVTGREKNLLRAIYERMDAIAASQEWEAFWKDKYNTNPMNDWSRNRKFLWQREEDKWCYTDLDDVEIYLDSKTVEQFLEKAIESVKNEQKQKSKFLENLTPEIARQILEAFNCFDSF
ncbi:hypothetical protein [Chroococcus sp. FPU101]|uniref:hypothetical protein n=1 Tax=Chroococcus sp. FPU101 TaxID=1974212 RepID=UPI001A900156|nr:hypothetical protein [Chroococcus sp. FPU101]GFE72243.1 hypothetical protein CFPU101_48530 [Chroococcus sp. FPU101]